MLTPPHFARRCPRRSRALATALVATAILLGAGAPTPAAGAGLAAPTVDRAASWKAIDAQSLEKEPRFPVGSDSAGPAVVQLQVLLDRAGVSPGLIDGYWGDNTERAVRWYRKIHGLEDGSEVDATLFEALREDAGGEMTRTIELAAQDLEGPFTEIPEDYLEQAKLDCLCYESAAERLAERYHTNVELLAQLNPDRDLEKLSPGDTLVVLAVEPLPAVDRGEFGEEDVSQDDPRIARLEVSKSERYLHALDDQGNILFHAPVTVGDQYDASPDASPEGELEVTALAFGPTFHYQPKLFADVPDSEPEAHLESGPNSPVGVVWIDLSKEDYGIHGSRDPGKVGHEASHGCVRLTNWDALFVAHRVEPGTPVVFR